MPLPLASPCKDALPQPATDKRMERSGRPDDAIPKGIDANNEQMLLQQVIGELRRVIKGPLCSLLVVCPSLVTAQTNLVPNPSFEELDVCPYAIGFQLGDRPRDWYSWNQSPDYFNACAQPINGADTLVGVPLNGWTYQPAWHGEAYVGMYAFGTAETYREYVGAELICPMVVGQTYHVSFRANLARGGTTWNSGGSCNNLGVLFTMESNAWTAPSTSTPGPAFAYRDYAHVYSQEVISDTADWILVAGDFTADSAYRHIVLGNFFRNALTDTIPSEIGYVLAYYLVDSVSVTSGPMDCPTSVQLDRGQGHSLTHFDQATKTLVAHTEGRAAYVVYDPTGRRVVAGSFVKELRVPANGWSEGMYVVHVIHPGGTKRLKFVVEH